MPEYRVYQIRDDGLIVDRFDLVCSDEVEARAEAVKLAADYDVELWELSRRIGIFKRLGAADGAE